MKKGRFFEPAVGGESIDTAVEGRKRDPLDARNMRELRDSPEKLDRVLISTPSGTQIPIAQLANLRFLSGPPMIRDQGGLPSGYMFVDMAGRDIGGYGRI